MFSREKARARAMFGGLGCLGSLLQVYADFCSTLMSVVEPFDLGSTFVVAFDFLRMIFAFVVYFCARERLCVTAFVGEASLFA